MNTPEQTKKLPPISHQPYFPHHRRMQGGRDYSKILREYNKPAQWYQPSSVTRSIYFYDPSYQKYLRERLISTINNRVSDLIDSFFLHRFLIIPARSFICSIHITSEISSESVSSSSIRSSISFTNSTDITTDQYTERIR